LGCTVPDDDEELNWIPIPEDKNKCARIPKTGIGKVGGRQRDVGGGVGLGIEINNVVRLRHFGLQGSGGSIYGEKSWIR